MGELPAAWLTIAATNNKLTEAVKRYIYARFPQWSAEIKAFVVLLASIVIGIGATAATEGAFSVFDGTFLAANPIAGIVVIGITSAFGADALRAILAIKDMGQGVTRVIEAQNVDMPNAEINVSSSGNAGGSSESAPSPDTHIEVDV